MAVDKNEINLASRGGTELMIERLEAAVNPDLLSRVQIIASRVRTLDVSKPRVLWCHDLPEDPESAHLANEGWKKFNRIVFVSYWQRDQYIARYGIPYSKTFVIRNFIDPIDIEIDNDRYKSDKLRIIYHTTPHRGLGLAVPIIEHLVNTDKIDAHFDVYSSFKIYGWEERDKEFEPLYDRIKANKFMTYHGFQPNDVIRQKLKNTDIFLYPCIWKETSCLAMIEAMSAGVLCIHTDLGALVETSHSLTYMAHFSESADAIMNNTYAMLKAVISTMKENNDQLISRVRIQKMMTDYCYGRDAKVQEWNVLLSSIVEEKPAELGETVNDNGNSVFHYKT